MPALDTDFSNHFRGAATRYEDGVGTETPFQLSNEAPAGMTAELEGRDETFVGLGGRAITATLYNEDKPNLTLIHPGWMGYGKHPLSQLQVSALAEKHPDRTFAFINMPGVGGSEALRRSAINHMLDTGSFEAYGEHIGFVLDALRKDYDATEGVGWSTGARAMFGLLASRHGEAGFDNIVALDPPGSHKLGRVGLISAFGLTEGRYAKLYTTDAQTVAAKAATAPKVANKPSAQLQGMWDFPAVMSQDGLMADMEKGTEKLDDTARISIVTPEFSALSKPENVAYIMQQLSKGTDAEMIHYIIERQSHTGLMDQDVPHFTQLIADTLSRR